MHNANQRKALAGVRVKKLLKKTLENLSSNPNIDIEFKMNFNTGYAGYTKTQFKMDALIKFKNSHDEIWLIKTTSSIRSDRVKGNQFDAQNIRKIEPNVKKIYLVTSDFADPREVANRKNYSEAIRNKRLYSEIDDVISFNALNLLIRDKALENLSQGVLSNILGEEAEERITRALNNDDNIELWNGPIDKSSLTKSVDYELFNEILLTYGIDPSEKIVALYSTTDIPLLEEGGQPKTDVHCQVITDKNTYNINISVKQTSAKRVTVHEGFVEDLLKVLNLNHSSELGTALLRLQECGGIRNLKEKYPTAHSTLEQQLHQYNNELIKFFLFGIGSKQEDIQIANMLVYNKTFKAMTVDNVIDDLKKSSGQFGTPFNFTYPSGGRGKKIQIKAPTNN